jgi:hypothetical protein
VLVAPLKANLRGTANIQRTTILANTEVTKLSNQGYARDYCSGARTAGGKAAADTSRLPIPQLRTPQNGTLIASFTN